MLQTHSTAEVAEQIGCKERWLLDQLRAGRFRGRKVGRHWRLMDADVEFALDVCANRVAPVVPVDTKTAFSTSRPRRRYRTEPILPGCPSRTVRGSRRRLL
jgi:excisionase family DNA binding protein